MLFYSWGGAQYLLLMLVSILVNYLIGLLIGKEGQEEKVRRIGLIIGILFNLGILGYFKYFNFLLDNIMSVGRLAKLNISFSNEAIALPVGISFFTFQILSYVIDVYRKEVKPQKSIINLTLYIMLFPQLIAGPIVRYIDIERQINHREVTLDKFSQGIRRFIIGFTKKVLLSNAVGFVADFVFNEASYYDNMILTWIGVICYALQIYHDFSGYSDMAIGLGKMFGFDFLENFNYPYISKSIKEFWNRWHMSLSTWFRDYIYIPLGGNRKGKFKTYRNLMIVFLVTGLWHGASWNFIVWGVFYGVFLILERGEFGQWLKQIPSVLQRVYSLLIILVGWVFFRADNLTMALKYIRGMFSFNFQDANILYTVIDSETLLWITLAILFAMPTLQFIKSKINIMAEYIQIGSIKETLRIIYDFGIIMVFILSCFYMTGSSFNPFIYFRF